MYREQYGEYAYWVLGVKGWKWKTNKQQWNDKDSVTQPSKMKITHSCCGTEIFNTWIVILASVQSNLKRKKQLLHLISLVLLQLKGNPGKHLPIRENRWITNYTCFTNNFFYSKIRHPMYFKQYFTHCALFEQGKL